MDVLDNRELSWLAFNERVLETAARTDTPLLERLRFAAIFENNLDEFFMVRIGTLMNRRAADDSVLDPRTRLSPSEQLTRIAEEVRRLSRRTGEVLSGIETGLAAASVKRLRFSELDEPQKTVAELFFAERVKPSVTVFPAGETPFVAGGRLCAAALAEGGLRFALCAADVPRLTALPCQDGFAYILTEDLLREKADELLSSAGAALFTVTRSADVSSDELPLGEMPVTDAIRQAVSLRAALPPVRVRISGGADSLRAALAERFSLSEELVFEAEAPLDMHFAGDITEALASRTELFYPAFTAAPPAEGSMIDRALDGDLLFSYPYESFENFLRLLEEAADDPRVTAIKITLYRTAHGSRVTEALCRAARNGKAVTVCVELKARFDERHNITSAERLKAAGCTVICGLYGVKVHSKLCLITMNAGGELVRVTQVGTGNYNESTAAQYTDLSLVTADIDIAADAENVFEALAAGRLPDGAYSLLVSPLSLKDRVLALLDEEIAAAESGASAYFGAKLNGLTDRDIIAKLIEASRRGVKIELIVRGICCLRPGVPGFTENIRVLSIVERYLEHARIYIFGSGLRQRVFISSADLMTRNTRRRVEAAAPIKDKTLRRRVTDYFAAQLADTADAWEKQPDGSYRRIAPAGAAVSSQQQFLREQGYNDKPEPAPLPAASLEKPQDEQAPAPTVSLEKPAEPSPEPSAAPETEPEQAAETVTEQPGFPEAKTVSETFAETPPEQPPETPESGGAAPAEAPESAPSAELPPVPAEPPKQGFFARIASFFKRLGSR